MAPRQKEYEAGSALFGVVLILLTVLVFSPSLGGEFLNWDDNLIIENRGWRGLADHHIQWWCTAVVGGDYKPLVWASYALDYAFWGLNPAGYHLGNILLHAANAFLLYLLIIKIIKPCRFDCAFLAACLFALHPLRVESVCWITGRKDVLSVFFYLLAILFYLRYTGICLWERLPAAIQGSRESGLEGPPTKKGVKEGSNKIGYYLLSVLCALLASLSKASAVTLPMVLILVDIFWGPRLHRSVRRVILEKIPYCIMAVTAAVGALTGQLSRGVLLSLNDVGLIERLLLAGRSWLFYLIKTVYPVGLQPLYPRVPLDLLPEMMKVLPPAGLLALTGLFIYLYRKRRPGPLLIWLLYLITLLPVSGLLPTGKTVLADRFSYLPAMAVSLAVYAGLVRIKKKAGHPARLVAPLLVAVLAILTIERESVWTDSINFWRYSLSRFPGSPTALDNLGNALYKKGRFQQAAALHSRALRYKQDDPNIHYNLALALTAGGGFDEALPHYREAIRLQPDHVRAWNNLGNALFLLERTDEAEACYREVIRHDPGHAGARCNLGIVFYRKGAYKEAAAELARALELNPGFATAREYYQRAINKLNIEIIE